MRRINKGLFNKLIEKVGWESVLYEALKELLQNVSPSINHEEGSAFVNESAYEETKELLKTYEQYIESGIVKAAETGMIRMGFKPSKTDIVSIGDDKYPGKISNNESKDPKSSLGTTVLPKRDESRDIVYRVTVLSPLGEESKPSPKPMRTVVYMDKDLGQSQGELPIPGNGYIVNRDRLQVTTKSGLFLGKADVDGQIKGSESNHVSGYIRTNGKYDLVFKDPKLGEALVVYEVLQERKPKEVELEMTCVEEEEDVSMLRTWLSFVRNPEVMTRADTLKKSTELLLDTLKKEHGMQVVSVTAIKVSKEFEGIVKNKPKV